MEHRIESSQAQAEICFQFEAFAQRLGFTVLAVHDLGESMLRRGRAFDEAGVVYSLVSWPVVDALLEHDPALVSCLPWRFAVYTRAGVSWLSFQPLQVPADTPPRLQGLLATVEEKLLQLVDGLR